MVAPLIRVESVSVGSRGQTPEGTAIALSARSGRAVRPDDSWTPWTPLALLAPLAPLAPSTPSAGDWQVGPARYVQWRATLSTEDRARTRLERRRHLGHLT